MSNIGSNTSATQKISVLSSFLELGISERKQMKYFQYLVMAALLLLLAACGQIQAPEVIPTEEVSPVEEAAPTERTLRAAATYANIVGTVYDGNTTRKVAGTTITLYRWNGSAWVSLGPKATTNSYGNYTISNAATGYYYQVGVGKTYGNCILHHYMDLFYGWSGYWGHTQTTRADARLYYNRTIPC